MDKNGNKTGGRQKGTPNKVNASIKARIKDFLIRNEAVMQAAFMEAKPGEKLKFWFNMTNLVCAKQTSSKDDGEWRPGEDIVADWSPKDEWFQKEMDEQYESLLGNRHKNQKVLQEQLVMAELFNQCSDSIKAMSNESIKNIMQLFPNEKEGRLALYHTLKGELDDRINQALKILKVINPIKYSSTPGPQPLKPANPIYDEEQTTTNDKQDQQQSTPASAPQNVLQEATASAGSADASSESPDRATYNAPQKLNDPSPKPSRLKKPTTNKQPFYASILNKRHKHRKYA